jgi:UDP-hydrolysing UDP-N-acetyl-D-glucosamine 2-epimerase
MRTIGIVTVARSDYGIYLSILRKIQADSELSLHLIVSGMHLSPEFGLTVRAIESDGFPIGERVEMLLSSDSPEGIAKSIGMGTIGFAQAFGRFRPDVLVVLGDRFEMFAAAVAALPFKIPVAHIHGGEITLGAIDDALRHSMTKLSHLHFASTQEYARRLRQMGEESWRITVSGAPGLDNIQAIRLLSPEELESRYSLHLQPPPLLVTFHPVTLEYERTDWQLGELLAALDEAKMPVVFTMPNADTGGRLMMQRIETFIRTRSWAQKVDNLGSQGYFSLMAIAMVMVGNSSSGIIEAPSFGLPVVNIGTRQTGRVKAANVIDVGYERTEILKGVLKALRPEFRAGLRRLSNPYGLGRASEIIVAKLKDVPLDDRLLVKRFRDLDITASDEG